LVTFRIHSITIDCQAWEPLVEFWSAASDFIANPDDPNNPGDPVGALIQPEQRLQLLFIPVPEGKTIKNRVHLDVQPTDRTRDEEVERLLGLGATIVDDRRRADGTGWVVMGDPEGNEFCVERSATERAASGRI
jgi:hypothetical protein